MNICSWKIICKWLKVMLVMGMTTDKVNMKCERKKKKKKKKVQMVQRRRPVRRTTRCCWEYKGTVEDEMLLVRIGAQREEEGVVEDEMLLFQEENKMLLIWREAGWE